MKKFNRIIVYICGLFALALGIVLNTKANLGVSPIISIPYSISIIWNINLGAVTAGVYVLFVLGQIVVLRKKFHTVQLLQIPLSIAFGMVINFFSRFITINSHNLLINLSLLALGISFTGLGVSWTLLMNILPNAADGFVQAISIQTGKKLGLVKNILDASSVALTIIIGLVSTGKIVGIGLGTVLAIIGVGRVIALMNLLSKKKLLVLVNENIEGAQEDFS